MSMPSKLCRYQSARVSTSHGIRQSRGRRVQPIPLDHKLFAFSSANEGTLQQSDVECELLTDVILPKGRLVIEQMKKADTDAVSYLLTRCFAGTMEIRNLSDVGEYVTNMVDMPPEAVLLVARLFPNEESDVKVPPGQDNRIVGAAAMSFSARTRDPIHHLPAPHDSAYLSNMAVDPKCRRMGVATLLLSACEQVTKTMAPSLRKMTLHVTLVNDDARALYVSAGFSTVAKDSFMARLRNINPVELMEKTVPP